MTACEKKRKRERKESKEERRREKKKKGDRKGRQDFSRGFNKIQSFKVKSSKCLGYTPKLLDIPKNQENLASSQGIIQFTDVNPEMTQMHKSTKI